jgi:hypothetical protein
MLRCARALASEKRGAGLEQAMEDSVRTAAPRSEAVPGFARRRGTREEYFKFQREDRAVFRRVNGLGTVGA